MRREVVRLSTVCLIACGAAWWAGWSAALGWALAGAVVAGALAIAYGRNGAIDPSGSTPRVGDVERDLLVGVLDGMSEGVLAFDRRGRVRTANRVAIALLGWPEVPSGLPMAAFADIPRLRSTVVAALGGRVLSRELDVAGPPARNLLVRAQPTPEGCVVVMLDVTQLRRLERVRRDFVSNVSHELRTPIAVIAGAAETLLYRADVDPTARGEFLAAIVRNADRLRSLVEQLLDLSRIESGGQQIDLRPTPLRAVVEELVEALDPAQRDRVAIEVGPDVFVLADEFALGQVLQNLVSNALRYAEGVVRMRARLDNGLRIEVTDEGPGISEEHRDRIFERFYRVDDGRSRAAGGSGLGLSIAKHLVEAMGGEMGVSPNAPRGAVFWVSLPLTRPPEDDDD